MIGYHLSTSALLSLVCLYVCLSVTLVHYVKTAKHHQTFYIFFVSNTVA